MNDDEINESMWALPIFDYVESFNERHDDVKIEKYVSDILNYMHLYFRPYESIKDSSSDMLQVAITHNDTYRISGNFNLRPIEWLGESVNKEKSRTLAVKILGPNFSETDEKHSKCCSITPNPLPHLVHRYFKMFGRNDYTCSELHFEPLSLVDFRSNALESMLESFIKILNE